MIQEHDLVQTIRSDDELGIPAGSVGAVIHIFEDGAAYEVEFPIPGQQYETVIATYVVGSVRPAENRTSATGLRSN